jgi:hypothetical protein
MIVHQENSELARKITREAVLNALSASGVKTSSG